MAEPHILLTVVAGTLGGQAGAQSRLAGGGLAKAGREHAAHDHFVDLARRPARHPQARP